jgi:hypothetical protein
MVAFLFPVPLFTKRLGVTQTDNRTSQDSGTGGSHTFNSCSLGATDTTRGIIVLAIHDDITADPGTTPTCTVGGTSMTRLTAETTGDGNVSNPQSVGTAIFVGTPSGTTGNVVVTWGSNPSMGIQIIVLRMVGYDTAGTGLSEAGTSSNGSQSWAITDSDALVYIAGSGNNNATMSFSGVTERGQNNISGNNRRMWGYDDKMAANAGLTVSVSPWSSGQGGNSMSGARFHAL